jgi:hypothetical protein
MSASAVTDLLSNLCRGFFGRATGADGSGFDVVSPSDAHRS